MLAVDQGLNLRLDHVLVEPFIAQALGVAGVVAVVFVAHVPQQWPALLHVVQAFAKLGVQLGKAIECFDAMGQAAQQRVVGGVARVWHAALGPAFDDHEGAGQVATPIGCGDVQYGAVDLRPLRGW